ncbi:MAG TPA: acetyl-CoA hydrolase/transferase C-terminal domain-containing protein [Bacteroidia bacterium]
MSTSTSDESLKKLRSGDYVYIHSVAAAPQELIRAMIRQADRVRNVQIFHLHTEGNADYSQSKYSKSFTVNSLFIAKNVREAVQQGRGNFIPIFLSEIPALFRNRIIPIDVALITVSPPDKHGFCSLGVSVDSSLAAIESARIIIAQVNKFMPRTHGDGFIHVNKIDHLVAFDEPLPEVIDHPITDEERAIGNNIVELIEDGSTLQMGVGTIPNAVLESLGHLKDLGIHTELFSDGIIPLVEKGVITGKYKKIFKGKIVSSLALGSRKLYDFIDDNPSVMMTDCSVVNDTRVIRKNPKVVAINSAIEIDLTGQVCADSIGHNLYSGVGGQMDFMRGASLSEGGKPIIAIPSTTPNGHSKIVPFLKPGAGVVTTRSHVHYVVTEFGVANLYGRDLKHRAKELIRIAHPSHREELEKQALEIYK